MTQDTYILLNCPYCGWRNTASRSERGPNDPLSMVGMDCGNCSRSILIVENRKAFKDWLFKIDGKMTAAMTR